MKKIYIINIYLFPIYLINIVISLVIVSLSNFSYDVDTIHKVAIITLLINYIIIFLFNGLFYKLFMEKESPQETQINMENKISKHKKITKSEFINSTITTSIVFSILIFILVNLF